MSFFPIGNKGSGKSALLSHFSDRTVCDQELVVDYSYVAVKNKFDAESKDGNFDFSAIAKLPQSHSLE